MRTTFLALALICPGPVSAGVGVSYALCTILSVTPYTDVVPVGMTFTVTAEIVNCGTGSFPQTADAKNVLPSPLAIAVYAGASVAVLTGPDPIPPYFIPEGNMQEVRWVCRAEKTGDVDISVTVSGQGVNMPNPPITNVERVSSTSFVIRGVELTATLYVTPLVAATGRPVIVEARVGNYGILRADGVVPLTYTTTACPVPSEIQVTYAAGGSVTEVSGPFPSCPASLNPGQEMTFTWTFTASRRGIVDFVVNFTASGPGAPISISQTATGERLVIQDLCAQVHIVPDRLTEGQDVTVLAQVTNCGQMIEADVSPQTYTATGCALPGEIALALSGSAKATLKSGPVPDCAVSLSPTQSAFFTWTFSTSITGSADFTVTFTGRGSGGSPFPQVSDSATLVIQSPAKLSVTTWSSPGGSVLYQQGTNVYLAITNIGQASADQVSPQAHTMTGTGSLAALPCAGGAACPVDDLGAQVTFIQGGDTRVFTWAYRAEKAGYVIIRGVAGAVDFNTRAPVLSPAVFLPITIPDPSQLSLTVTGSDLLIQGQEFAVNVAVFNPAGERLCQYGLGAGGFEVFLNGVTEKVSIVSVEPPIPRCYEPCASCPGSELNCCRREFTVTMRMAEDAPLGPAELTFAASGYDQAGIPIVSSSTALPLVIHSGKPGIASVEPNPYRILRGGGVAVNFVVSPEQAGKPLSLKVYTITGEIVATLSEEILPAGMHPAVWDGRNAKGDVVASGIYLLLFDARHGRDVRKLAVIK